MMGSKRPSRGLQGIGTAARSLAVAAVCAAALLLGASPSTAAGRTLRVGYYDNAPKVFKTEFDEPAGIFVDVIRYVAKQEGWKIEFVYGTWKDGLAGLENGAVDLMPDVAYTAERAGRFAYNKEPVLSDWLQVFAANDADIKSILDLEGRRVAVLDDSIQETLFSGLAKDFSLTVSLVAYPDLEAAFDSVRRGETEAVIANRFFGAWNAGRFELQDTAIIVHPNKLFFAAAPGADRGILDAIDRHVLALKKDPNSEYYRSLERWTTQRPDFSLPRSLKVAGIVLVVFLLVSLSGSLLLSRLVAIRTRALKRSENKYYTLFHTANDAIFLMDGDRFVDCNDRTLRMFGCAKEDILGQSPVRFSPPAQPDGRDTADSAREKIDRAVAGAPQFFEWRHRRPDGTEFDAEVALNGLVLEGRTLLQAIVRDVSERKRAEEELRRLNAELERRVVERTADLSRAKERAESADRLKSAFLAAMSHELRTPLNSIIGFTGILLQQLAGPLNPEQNKQLGMVQSSARHLLSLINDVLDLSKIEAGQLPLSVERFNVLQSIRMISSLIAPQAAHKQIEVRLSIPDEFETVAADRRRFEQILLNVLNNAVKFTEKGHVEVTCRAEGPDIRIAVTDTGIGIREEDLALLFRPFHQVDAGPTRRYEGTGLGLSICRKLLELMGGDIEVESERGRGSTFTVRIPRGVEETP